MKILVISPTFNEKKNIADLIQKIFKLNNSLHMLIVDDNSPDGTSQIVKNAMETNENIHLIEREGKLGLGTAYCRGFEYALKNGYDRIIQMDADLSHNPDDVLRLIHYSETYDLVIGSRYKAGVNVINWPMSRLLLSYFANLYARIFTRVPIRDLTGGFKCFRRSVLEAIDYDNICSQGYSFQIEMNFLAYNKGFKLIEIPIVFTDRTVGESKMNKNIVFEAIFMVPKLLFRKIFRIY